MTDEERAMHFFATVQRCIDFNDFGHFTSVICGDFGEMEPEDRATWIEVAKSMHSDLHDAYQAEIARLRSNPEVPPLGSITKTDRGFERIQFSGSYGGDDHLEQSTADYYNPPLPIVTLGDRCGGDGERVYLDADQVRSLITHLQAWLETGSFEIKAEGQAHD